MNTLEEERTILKGLATEDKSSIESIYKEHYNFVKSLVINNSGTADDAADLFQDVVVVLFEKSKQPLFELNCQLRTFIYSVARRLWLKKLQPNQRLVIQSDSLEETVPVEEEIESHLKKQDNFNIMEQALSKIGEPCKSLLEAYYIQMKHMHEIAASFGYTNADNAKTQKYKCLVRLKKLFFAQYKKEE